MKKHLAFAGVVVAGLVVTMAVVQAQRPGGMGRSGGALGQGPGQGMGPGFGRMGGGPGGPGGPMFGRRGGGPGMMLAGLNLSADQQAQIKTLFESERDSRQAGMRALADARQALHAAVFANAVDAGAVAALQAKVIAAEQAQLAARVQTELTLAGILTPDQRAKLLARGGRGPGRPGRPR